MAGVRCTDTEKELDKLKVYNQSLEIELKKVKEENNVIRQQITSPSESGTKMVETQTLPSTSAISSSGAPSSLTELVNTVTCEGHQVDSLQSQREPGDGDDIANQKLSDSLWELSPDELAVIDRTLDRDCRSSQTDGGEKPQDVAIYGNHSDMSPQQMKLQLYIDQLAAREAEIQKLKQTLRHKIDTKSKETSKDLMEIIDEQKATIQRQVCELAVCRDGISAMHRQFENLRKEHNLLKDSVREILREKYEHMQRAKDT
ncbi:hypothetical protein ElyMa_005701100, partial [Elysia marginata]